MGAARSPSNDTTRHGLPFFDGDSVLWKDGVERERERERAGVAGPGGMRWQQEERAGCPSGEGGGCEDGWRGGAERCRGRWAEGTGERTIEIKAAISIH